MNGRFRKNSARHLSLWKVQVPGTFLPVGYYNFGGWKRSKFGEGHMFGPDTARFFTKSKTVSERWPECGIEQASFSFPSN